jgi:alpha-L-fucosidase 2
MVGFVSLLASYSVPTRSASIPNPDSGSNPNRIWAGTVAADWSDSFLIGNGRVGAVIGGGIDSDLIYVNEDSFWSGGPLHRVNPDAASHMPIIQQNIRNGGMDIEDAATLASYAYVGTPVSTQHYDTLGWLGLTMDNGFGNATGYERWLDLGDGTSGVYYSVDDVTYEREFLASEPAGLIAFRIRSSKAGAVSFHLHLDRSEDESLNRWEDYSQKVGSDTIIMGGGSGGLAPVQFAVGAKIKAPSGTVSTIGDTLFCKNATEAWVYIQSWTSYRREDPKSAVLDDLAAATQSYEEIRSAHLTDYQTYFNRVSLDLGKSTAAQMSMTTGNRINATNSTFDPGLASLYFQFGRYLLISTSREGTLPRMYPDQA